MANEWWKNVAFLGDNPFMPYAQKAANYQFGDNQNLDYDEGLTDWASPMGPVPDAPRMPPMLDQTGQMGASNYRAPQVVDEKRIPGRIQKELPTNYGILENFKNKLSGFTTPAIDFMKKMTAPMSPEKRAEVEAIQGGADKYGWGNLPGTGLQGNVWQGSGGRKINVRDPVTGTQILRDKNLQSAFGSKTIADMIQKKEDWAKGQFEKYGDEWSDDEHRGLSTKLYNYYKRKGLIDKWKGPTPVDTTGKGTTIGEITGGAIQGGQGDYQRAPINEPDKSFSDPSTTGYMGPGGVHYAQGGRIGYQDGEFVDEDINIEGPGYDINENIEMASGEPSREQLEAIALEIFRLPLEELDEQQLMVVYQAAMEQEPSEEEVQFAAQEGPGEGIASLV